MLRGQVEVSDFKTGQIAQVMPGQAATAFEHGKPGISLSGAGTFNPIEHGKPRASTIERVPVPKSGLSALRSAANGRAIHALGPVDKGTKAAGAAKQSHQAAGVHAPKAGVVRISSSLGEVKLNVHKVTHGLAHGAVAPGQVRNANASASAGTETVWSDTKASTTTAAANSSNATAVSVSSSSSSASATSASASATTVATTAGPPDGSPGNGSNGNGNNGATGNGNGSNGHGNAYGHNKH
ncbi:hypothetical protein ACVW0I_005796 [Bradyrhizobium sp. LM6.11]